MIFHVLLAFQEMLEGRNINFCWIFGKSNQISKNIHASVNLDVHPSQKVIHNKKSVNISFGLSNPSFFKIKILDPPRTHSLCAFEEHLPDSHSAAHWGSLYVPPYLLETHSCSVGDHLEFRFN